MTDVPVLAVANLSFQTLRIPAEVDDAAVASSAGPVAKPVPCVSHQNLMHAALSNASSKAQHMAFSWLKDNCEVACSFTNQEIWHFSGLIGRKLIETHKMKRGDRVMIVFPFGLDFIIAFLACLRVGVVVVSVYPPNPAKLASDIKKFSHFVEDSGARIALTTRKYASMVRYSGMLHKWPKNLQWVATDSYPRRIPAESGFTQHDIALPQSSALAFVQYTSGSTGRPKGVMITHGNLQHQLNCLASFPRPYTRHVGWVPQYHDMGLFNILAAMFTGTPAWLMSPIQFIQNPVLWPQAIEKYKATWIAGPNFSLALTSKRLEQQSLRFDCSTVDFCGIGAEPTQPATLQSAVEVMGLPASSLVNMYGLAESCLFVIGRCHPDGPLVDESNRVCVGSRAWSAALGIDVVVAKQQSGEEDEEGEEEAGGRGGEMAAVEDGEVGEICVRSASVAAGYYRQEELSKSTFAAQVIGREGSYLRTGDLGYARGDNLFVTCRLKDLIIINGRNVWPVDLELAAEGAFPSDLRPGCSAAFQGSEAGAVLVCELREARENVERIAGEVRRAVESECGIEVERVVLVNKGQVPKTTSGKVSRRAAAEQLREGKLKTVAEAESKAAAAGAAGGPALEDARTLEEVLEISGVEDLERSVVENGLSSLQVMEVVNVARSNLGLEIGYEELSDMPASELLQRYSSPQALAPPARPPLLVSLPATPTRTPPGRTVRILLQSLILLLQLAVILLAAVPSIALVDEKFEAGSDWWLNRGRAGPWLAVAVVMWMASYTVLCIVFKWVLVGRMRAGYAALWGPRFTLWMAVERLFTVWEYVVGRFLLETPWMVLIYKLCGADVAWSANIDACFRCWDLVKVGPRARVSGTLHPRVFDKHGVRFGRIVLGADAKVRGMAVVQGPAAVEEEVEVEACTTVPPHSELGPRGSKWHGNLCRLRPGTGGEPGPEGECASEPWWATRLLLPVVCFASNAAAFFVATSAIGAVQPASEAWSRDAWLLGLSYLLAFFVAGLQLMAFVVLLKWSFLSPFLTDALASLTVSTYLPFLERNPLLVTAWHRLLGMRCGAGVSILYTWSCPPSKAHLCTVGRNSLVFSTVLAPRTPASLWSWLAGRSGAPWFEARDIVIGSNCGLYAQGRVERGVRMCDGSQLAGFSRVEAETQVESPAMVAGNPSFRLEQQPGAAIGEGATEDGGMGWRFSLVSLVLLVVHRGFVSTVIAVAIHAEKELPGAGDLGGGKVGVYCAVLLRIALLLAWIVAGEYLEMWLFKRTVLGRAQPQEVELRTWKGLLVMHGTMLWDQSLPLCCAFLSGGFGLDVALWMLGFDIDVGMVLCVGIPVVAAQDAEVTSIGTGAIIDDLAYVSAHNLTMKGITVAPASVGPGAVVHPLGALFCASLAADGALYPRAKSLRELQTAEGEAWVGGPAYCALCRFIDVDGGPDSDRALDGDAPGPCHGPLVDGEKPEALGNALHSLHSQSTSRGTFQIV